MKKIKSKILKMSIQSKIICVLLTITLVVSAVIYNFSGVEAQGEEVVTDKTYLSDIVDRITAGKQKYFTILEIVPYTGMGEFRYFAGSDEVEAGLLNKSQSELKELYNKCGGYGIKNDWVKMNYLFSNFNYEIKYDEYQNTYKIKCDEIFNNYVLQDPFDSLLEGRIMVNTVEANDLTQADLDSADLVIISVTPQDNSTIAAYNYYSKENAKCSEENDESTNVYDKEGKELHWSKITYETYEKSGSDLISRDISWEMATKLLDYMMVGRDLKGDGKYTKTPVILDAKASDGLSRDCNMYKIALIYRMLESSQYKDFMTNHMTTVDENGKQYINKTGVTTAALYYTDESAVIPTTPEATTPKPEPTTPEETSEGETPAEGEETTPESTTPESTTPEPTTPEPTTPPASNVIRVLEFTHEDIIKCVDANECIDTNPNARKRLTNDYWVHNGAARIIPSNRDRVVTENDYVGINERGLNNKTVADIIRYLLGCKGSYVIDYDFSDGPIRILEVEPCNSFRYSDFTSIKALADGMGLDTSKWNSTNYKQYLTVTCLSTKALNTVTTDLISTYDAIIIGDKDDMLTKDSAKKTIYNDKTLNGYVYLAYGDLSKLSSPLLGNLPIDYVAYKGSINNSTGELTNSDCSKGLKRITDYETIPRRKHNWGSSNGYADWTDLEHQMKYNYMYTVSETTKSVWTDYQWDFLSEKHSGQLVGVIDTYNYYKNHKKTTSNDDLFADPIGNGRFSDNDFTERTKEKLVQYADAGKLLIMADMVYDNDGSKVYPTSKVAEFSSYVTAPGSGANYLRQKNIKGLLTHVNVMSPTLKFTLEPTTIAYDDNGIINKYNSTGHELNYAFTIDAYANTTYKIKLIIDKNGDGIFSDEGGYVQDDTNEIFKTMVVTTDASGRADVSLSTNLASNYNGIVAWKIEVAQMKDTPSGKIETTLRSSQIGYTAVKSEEVMSIKVLQILPTRQYFGGGDYGLALNMSSSVLSGDNIPKGYNDGFKQVLEAVNGKVGYQIEIVGLRTYEFENKYNKNVETGAIRGQKYIEGESYGKNEDYLNANKYDMVVIGFADSYNFDDISNTYGAVDNIKDFIKAGNSVMFAHDTMSYNSTINYFQITQDGLTATSLKPKAKYITNDSDIKEVDKICTELTSVLRNTVGMDKYGITLSVDDRDGKTKPTYYSGAKVSYATETSSDGKYYVNELQGFSDWAQWKYSLVQDYKDNNTDGGLYNVKPYNTASYLYRFSPSKLEEIFDWKTNRVEKVNEGQVTMFPYKMDSSIKVAPTHCQWYQLDMNDPELVVWYTLSGDNYYRDTKLDGQNNYYIYSKGNVTYTGAGHGDIFGDNPEEQKLFVNTIIRAIGAANAIPDVTVTNGSMGSGIYNIYASVGDTYTLKFKATDADLLTPEAVNYDYNSVGLFNAGRVIYDKNDDGVYNEGDVVIKTYGAMDEAGSKLMNDVVNSIELEGNAALQPHWDEVRGKIEASGAKFIIEAYDKYNEKGTAVAKITTRELFALD